MPRVTVTNDFIEGGISDALEWIIGDAAQVRAWLGGADGFPSYVALDEQPPVSDRIDLDGHAVSAVAEFYNATVTVARARGRASIRVSDLAVAGQGAVDLSAAVLDAANGEITVTLPSTLWTGPPPAAGIVDGVPVVIVYVTSNRGGEIRTSRFLVILRRGVPAIDGMMPIDPVDPPDPTPTTKSFLGWSSTRAITPAHFANAEESDDDEWLVPDGAPGYLWYGVEMSRGAPSHETVSGFRQPDNAFTPEGQVDYDSSAYLVFVTAQQLAESAEGRPFGLEFP